jgi:hypothetical protein
MPFLPRLCAGVRRAIVATAAAIMVRVVMVNLQ